MQLHILPSDELPIYRQIVDQILDGVARGLLGRGERLPSQRELAERLVISPHTVEKAYAELRHAGLVEMRPGLGTFLRRAALTVDPGYRRRRIATVARRLVAEAHLFDMPMNEVSSLVGEADTAFRTERVGRSTRE